MRRYTTLQDVIDFEIKPALDGSDVNLDFEELARATYAWRIDEDERGNELLDTAGYEQVVSVGEFWTIVEQLDQLQESDGR